MYTLIKNCHLVSPGIEFTGAAVLLKDNKVCQVSPGALSAPVGAAVIDAEGGLVTPGFIDVHCHGRNNSDFSDGLASGVETIGLNKLAEGVTLMLPTTLTLAEETLAETMCAVAAYKQDGCRMPGVHLEGPFVNPKCCGAQNPAFLRKPDAAEVARLAKIFPVRKITYAVELEGGTAFTSDMLNMGITPSCTHSAAKYAEFRSAYAAGLRNLSHFCNQMSALHHRDIGLVGAGLLHDDVYTEFICDKLHIDPAMIQLVFKIKDCDHVILITDAMRAAGMPDGDYTLGGLPVVVANGAARLREGGALAGSTLQLNAAFRNIAEVTGLPLSQLVNATSWNAARSLGLTGFGKIEPGYFADIVIMDSQFNVRKTLVNGEVRFSC